MKWPPATIEISLSPCRIVHAMVAKLNEPNIDCESICWRLNWVFRLLVVAQFVLIALLLFAQPTPQRWHARLVSFIGVAFGLWAVFTMGRYTNISPRLRQNAILRINGPYRFVRHPMYLAVMVFCGGYLVSGFTVYKLLVWLSIFGVLVCKMYYEERILRQKFTEYSEYATTTKKIVPFIF